MRETKLRDFLVYYKEVDLWTEYKDKNIVEIRKDVQEYENGMHEARQVQFKRYTDLRQYFTTLEARRHNDADRLLVKSLHQHQGVA